MNLKPEIASLLMLTGTKIKQRHFLGRVWWIYFLLVSGFFFILLYPFVLLFMALGKQNWVYPLRRLWARICLFVGGFPHRIIGPRPERGPYIFIGNHFSYLDIMSCLAYLPQPIVFMGKAELEKIPLLGYFFKRAIDIAVPREDSRGSAIAFRSAGEMLKTGRHIVIFPEGGMLGDAPKLHPFKEGAFLLAIFTKSPLVPFTLPDNWIALPDGPNTAYPRRLRLILHPPVSTADRSRQEAGALCQEVYTVIKRDLDNGN